MRIRVPLIAFVVAAAALAFAAQDALAAKPTKTQAAPVPVLVCYLTGPQQRRPDGSTISPLVCLSPANATAPSAPKAKPRAKAKRPPKLAS